MGSARWTKIERDLRAAHGPLLAGVDEVGRGPLAGPVVACAVIMPAEAKAIRGVDDSKLLPAAQRDKLAGRIRERALAIAIGAASVREIDRLNIYHASTLAIRRAILRLPITPQHVVLDGNRIRALGVEHTAVVGGDGRCHSIACASIIAKVTRDRLMKALARRHPQYRWETNVGYGTSEHHAGLAAHGITRHHRRSFTAVAQLSLGLAASLIDEHALVADALADIGADRAHRADVPFAADVRASVELAT